MAEHQVPSLPKVLTTQNGARGVAMIANLYAEGFKRAPWTTGLVTGAIIAVMLAGSARADAS